MPDTLLQAQYNSKPIRLRGKKSDDTKMLACLDDDNGNL